jgi:imidazolonepropionase
MELQDTHGSITPGKKANFIITEPVPSYTFLPYSFGRAHAAYTILNGEKQG